MQSETFRINKSYFKMMLIAGILWSMLIIGIPYLILVIIIYKTTALTVDSTGVTFTTGVFVKRNQHIPFNRINNIDLEIGPVGKAKGYGNITILTGNDTQKITFKGVDRPERLRQLIQSRIS